MPESAMQSSWRGYRKYAFALLWAVILSFLFLTREIMAPFLGSLLIAYLLAPLVAWLGRIKFRGGKTTLPNWVSVLLIYGVLGLTVWLYCFLAVPKISAEFGKLAKEGEKLFQTMTPEQIEEYSQRVKTWVEDSGLPVRIVTPATHPAEGDLQPGFVLDLDEVIRASVADLAQWAKTAFFRFLRVGPAFAMNLFRSVLMTFLVLMVAAFLLMSHERLLNFFQSLFPKRHHLAYREVLKEMDIGLTGVVRGQVMICVVNGVLTFVGLIIIGVKFPVILSTLAAVLSLIPIFGSIISSIPIVAVAITGSFYAGLATLGWIVGIHLVEANLLNPKIIGDAAKIHPALVIFSLVAGEHFFGIIGALFAVPITAVGLAMFKVFHRRAIKWNREHDQESHAQEKPEIVNT